MIENGKQYCISKRKIRELNGQIEKINNDTDQNPLRNQLILVSLINNRDEMEKDIRTYELLKKKDALQTMIETQKQYELSKRKLAQLKVLITTVEQDTELDPLENQLILVSLRNSKTYIESEISRYLSQRRGGPTSLY